MENAGVVNSIQTPVLLLVIVELMHHKLEKMINAGRLYGHTRAVESGNQLAYQRKKISHFTLSHILRKVN